MPISKYGTSIISSSLQNCILGPGADGQVPSSRFMASIRYVDDQYIQHREKNQAGKGGEKFSPTEMHHSHKKSVSELEIEFASKQHTSMFRMKRQSDGAGCTSLGDAWSSFNTSASKVGSAC